MERMWHPVVGWYRLSDDGSRLLSESGREWVEFIGVDESGMETPIVLPVSSEP